jgi:hypothetical protein
MHHFELRVFDIAGGFEFERETAILSAITRASRAELIEPEI